MSSEKAEDKKKKSDGAPTKGAAKSGSAKGKSSGKGDKAVAIAKTDDAPIKRTAPARLRTKYDKEIKSALMQEFGYKSTMAVPKLVKITINMGLGASTQNPKIIDAAQEELSAICGQKPIVTRARKSIATFKLRQGQRIGCAVTLRRDRMYEFLDRLVTFALPRTRDFKGVSNRSFDGRGNYSLGIKEQIIFPEINYDRIEKIMGMNITFVTTATTDKEGAALLRHFGMPFRR